MFGKDKQRQMDLFESERSFRLLVEGVADYALFMLDPGGIVTSWNIGAQRIKGYAPPEILGQHFSRFYTEADRANGKPARLHQALEHLHAHFAGEVVVTDACLAQRGLARTGAGPQMAGTRRHAEQRPTPS